MIIKNLYIKNFGGLRDKNITFGDRLNILSSDNETGKSTVAEFIKIMLYGISRGQQNIRGNERARFMPWGEKSMGGEITISKDRKDYTIIRTFGKRKSDDKISVINALTGAPVPELCIESPGDVLLGIGKAGFEKSLYIKQLSSKIEPDKEDEILQKLVNLAQSGDEEISYQRAALILDKAAKELNGSRPKGKILMVREEISNLASRRTDCENSMLAMVALEDKLKALAAEKGRFESFSVDKTRLEELKKEYSDALVVQAGERQRQDEFLHRKASRLKGLKIQTLLSSLVLAALLFFRPLFSVVFLVWAVLAAVFFFKVKKTEFKEAGKINSEDIAKEIQAEEAAIAQKERENTAALLEVVRQIGEAESRLDNMDITPVSEIEEKIKDLQNTYHGYLQALDDIMLAKKCLDKAFEILQSSFGKRLNDEASKVLTEIANGKYTEVLVDNEYNMLVRASEENALIDAQYLSSGAYDQIYFSLRMAVVNLLFDNAPVIFDEAFVQYDDTRLSAVLDYIIKQENRQILLFSCHKREQLYFKDSQAPVLYHQ